MEDSRDETEEEPFWIALAGAVIIASALAYDFKPEIRPAARVPEQRQEYVLGSRDYGSARIPDSRREFNKRSYRLKRD